MKQVRHIWNSDMYKKGRPVIFLILVAVLMTASTLSHMLDAHSRTLGAGISYNSLSVIYEHTLKDNSFIELSLKAESTELSAGRSSYPGASFSVTWNYILKEWKSAEGNTINFFVGPGVIAGYSSDYKTNDGLILGIKGRVGFECLFVRNIAISAAISPVIGSHIVHTDAMTSMKYYRNGLQYALIPEIGIKYRF